MSDTLVYIVGFSAQLLFGSRLLVQWVKSEKAGRVLSPTLFWQLSLIASFLLMVYGILRDDLVIILGQTLSYFIYIRNLQYKSAWSFIPLHFKAVVIIFPFVAIVWLASGWSHSLSYIIENNPVPMAMVIWGSIGQVIFTFRFIYQWYYSEKAGKSILPRGFWIISLIGASIIISYGVYRLDPVIILGQVFGTVIYSRNLFLSFKKSTKKAEAATVPAEKATAP